MVIDLKNTVLQDMILRWLNSRDLTVELITEKIKDDPDEAGSYAGITKKAAESLLAMRNGMENSQFKSVFDLKPPNLPDFGPSSWHNLWYTFQLLLDRFQRLPR